MLPIPRCPGGNPSAGVAQPAGALRGDIASWPTADYLTRNKQIVDACEVRIAYPAGEVEEVRSGTWSTVRYARRKGKPVWLVFPDGTVIEEAKRS